MVCARLTIDALRVGQSCMKSVSILTGKWMARTWYVTFEAQKRGILPRRRSPRVTSTFDTEMEAKEFARQKVSEGLAVYAGTINPYVPKQLISASRVSTWLDDAQEPDSAQPGRAHSKEK